LVQIYPLKSNFYICYFIQRKQKSINIPDDIAAHNDAFCHAQGKLYKELDKSARCRNIKQTEAFRIYVF